MVRATNAISIFADIATGDGLLAARKIRPQNAAAVVQTTTAAIDCDLVNTLWRARTWLFANYLLGEP